ncbi:MAG: hypothetical protein IJ955_00160 [Oscillospiraceae bacterium]|nr:hypothetical protein [Oscillospiraceae bacterium]
MKKLLPLFLIICLLTGCGDMKDYYSTPAESYQKGFKDSHTVRREIDCIELDDNYAFWLAIVDTADGPRIIEALTEVKKEHYRVIDRSHLVDLSTASTYSLKEGDIAWNVVPVDNRYALGWVWANPESVSGAMREKYDCKDYLIQEDGKDYSATLIYYFMDLQG